jgi:hypothetical protein
MALVVHLADAKDAKAIARSGLRPAKGRSVVYFMPVTQNHFISHQWLRELKRSGAKEIVGVYIQLSSSEMVFAGRYNEEHLHVPLGKAIQMLHERHDPRGFEVFIDRKIMASEIDRIRSVPQVVGWRYFPDAHLKGLTCGCPACVPRGSIKSRDIINRLDEPPAPTPTIEECKAKLPLAGDYWEISDCLWPLRRKRLRMSPDFLSPLLSSPNESVLIELATTLPFFRHKDTLGMLKLLEANENERVSAFGKAALATYRSGNARVNERFDKPE